MAQKKKQSEGVGAWIAIVVLFVIGAWPIALIILFIKLFGSDSRRKQQTVPPLEPEAQQAGGAASAAGGSRARKAVHSAMKSPAVKSSNAKWLKIVGAVLTVCGLAACWSTFSTLSAFSSIASSRSVISCSFSSISISTYRRYPLSEGMRPADVWGWKM